MLTKRLSNQNTWRTFFFLFFVTHLSALGRMYHCSVKKWILLGEVTAFVEILWCRGEMSTWCVLQLRPSLKIVPGTPCLRGGTRINAMIITKDWHQGDLAKRLIKLRYSEFLRRGSLGIGQVYFNIEKTLLGQFFSIITQRGASVC